MLRLKQKKEDKKAAEAAEAPPAAAESKAEGTRAGEDKKEIKLFNSIGGVALKTGGDTKSGRQITPGELRIQRGTMCE